MLQEGRTAARRARAERAAEEQQRVLLGLLRGLEGAARAEGPLRLCCADGRAHPGSFLGQMVSTETGLRGAMWLGHELPGWAWRGVTSSFGLRGGLALLRSLSTRAVRALSPTEESQARDAPREARAQRAMEAMDREGAAVDVAALVRGARANSRFVAGLFLLVVVYVANGLGKDTLDNWQDGSAQKGLPTGWLLKQAAQNAGRTIAWGWLPAPQTLATNLLAATIAQLAKAVGMDPGADPMPAVTNGLKMVLAWEVLAHFVQLHTLDPLRQAANALWAVTGL